MGTEGRVYGPVVAWLVLKDVRGCSAKFSVAISRFVVLMRRSVTVCCQKPTMQVLPASHHLCLLWISLWCTTTSNENPEKTEPYDSQQKACSEVLSTDICMSLLMLSFGDMVLITPLNDSDSQESGRPDSKAYITDQKQTASYSSYTHNMDMSSTHIPPGQYVVSGLSWMYKIFPLFGKALEVFEVLLTMLPQPSPAVDRPGSAIVQQQCTNKYRILLRALSTSSSGHSDTETSSLGNLGRNREHNFRAFYNPVPQVAHTELCNRTLLIPLHIITILDQRHGSSLP